MSFTDDMVDEFFEDFGVNVDNGLEVAKSFLSVTDAALRLMQPTQLLTDIGMKAIQGIIGGGKDGGVAGAVMNEIKGGGK